MNIYALVLSSLLALPLPMPAPGQAGSRQLAVVNGETITEAEVLKAAAADLARLDANKPQPPAAYDRARLEVLWTALNSLIDDKLITASASRDKITKEHLLESEVESNVATPSPDEVDAFYEANKDRIPLPKAQALPQVRQYMIDQSRKRYHDMLIARLKRDFSVKTFLDPVRTEIATAGYPSKGPASAPVVIVEFSDFECPFCGRLFPILKAVEQNYPDKVRIVYRQFPLTSIHPRAQKAAEASLCANEQKKFWEFHDSMFADQSDLTVDALKRRAVQLKLDAAAFNSCLDSGRQAAAVKTDADEGAKAGVTGTPAMFINGRLLAGVAPYADIREIIEDELQRAAAGGR